MKKVFLFALISAATFYSCDDVKDAIASLTVFDIDYETEVTIPSTTIVGSLVEIGTPTITTNSESRFENNNTKADLVERATLKSMTLTIDSPDDGNFNFLREIKISIKAEGLERIQIASLEDIGNDGVKTLDLETSEEDLKEYLKKDSFDLSVSTATDETIGEDHNISVKSVFEIDAEIFGL